MIHQEAMHTNPKLGELLPIPLYPHQSLPQYLPYEGLDYGCKGHKRKVVLTTSIGESLIWMSNIHFVIDVGVERRKVNSIFHSFPLLLPKLIIHADPKPCQILAYRASCSCASPRVPAKSLQCWTPFPNSAWIVCHKIAIS